MSTDSAPSSARSRVLHVTELLEAVLMQLDLRTLLVSAQRVNKRWYNVIGNANLQKKLFFLTDHDATVIKENELLREIFLFCFPVMQGGPDRNISTSNTRLHQYRSMLDTFGQRLSWTEWITFRDRADAFSRVDASWRHCVDGVVYMSTTVQHALAPEESLGPMYTDNFPQGRKTNVGVINFSLSKELLKELGLEHRRLHRQADIHYFIDRDPSDGPCPKFAGIAKILLPRKSLGERCSRFLESIVQSILRALLWLLGRL
ncbi:hypothetical protein BJ166DRAFT_613417 [Pestalotiopsis sp. NC0098]|nr:hypothetical protein BJ166DRAFT_613417 [Pestalotiopsis sp. NC0098]